jgi:hypothetical protein
MKSSPDGFLPPFGSPPHRFKEFNRTIKFQSSNSPMKLIKQEIF